MNDFTKEMLTEKAHLRKDTVDGAKAQALAKIALPLEATPNGEHAMILGVTEDGRNVYLTVKLTVGFADPFIKIVKKEKAKKVTPVVLPDLFAE